MGNKHFEKGGEPLKTLNDLVDGKYSCIDEVEVFAKELKANFNLTEEDLK